MTPELEPDEVHVWSASLEQDEPTLLRLRAVLDDDERRRADRYMFEKGRRQSVVARGLLRIILGEYLACDPSALRFRYNGYGKPELDRTANDPDWTFNLSHSGSVVLYAVSRGRDLGVDVETVRPDFATQEIAERFFAPREVAALRAVPVAIRPEAFFHCWTRKEAYIKAQGKGLSIALDSFEVSLAPGARAELLATHDDPREADRWTLHELAPGPGYVGALAVAGSPCRLLFKTWPADSTSTL
jgi:4'-phosphopantetheinyl transferase